MKCGFCGIHVRVIAILVTLFLLSAPGLAQQPNEVSWTRLPGTATDLSINAEGQAYAVGLDGTPWRWDAVEQRWRKMSGRFVRISAAEGNRPWAINSDGVVYRYNGLWWENKDEDVADVAADTVGNVYIAKADGAIKKWNPLRSEWRPVDGDARRLAVGGDGLLWAVTKSGAISSFDGTAWKVFPGLAQDIAVGSTNAVAIIDADGLVRVFNAVARRWNVVAGVKDAVAVAVTPDGGPWAVTRAGHIMATALLKAEVEKTEEVHAPEAKVLGISAPVSAAPVSTAQTISAAPAAASPVVAPPPAAPAPSSNGSVASSDPATVTAKGDITFVDTRKSAASIAIGKDGSVFGLDPGGDVLRWSNARKTFDSFPGTLVSLAVAPDGNPWGISALGRVFRHTGRLWQQIAGATGSDISVGASGTVMITDASSALYKLNAAGTRFDRATGNGQLIAVGPDDVPWTVRTDKLVQRCDTNPCTVIAQKATSIAVGPDNSVWLVSDRNFLMRLKADGKSFEVVRTPGHTPAKVAVGPNGYPWVVTSTQAVLSSKYFDRDESGDRVLAASTAGDTVGSGATSTVVSSQTSSITFSKNMKFETIDTDVLSPGDYALLDAGNDGYIYGHTTGISGIYNTKTKKFEVKTTQLATDTYDITSFGVASNGDIWAYALNPYTGLFRERNKTLTEYTVSGGDIQRVTVGPDDTVYASVSFSGGNYYLYMKAPSATSFTKFSTFNEVSYIGIGPGNDVWIVDQSSYVRQWTGSTFEKRPLSGQKANRISVGADGTVYIVDTNNAVRKWNGANNSFDAINNVTATYITVDDDGRPWLSVDNTPTVKRAK